MNIFLFQPIENVLIVYFTLYLLLDTVFFVIFIVDFIRQGKNSSMILHQLKINSDEGISILVPAYNEAVSIRNCLEMLTRLDYPHFEIIVINDGSRDNTLQEILSTRPFEPVEVALDSPITTQSIRSVFRHQSSHCPIYLIDKENGGKADALNAGLKLAGYPLVCTIDADSILDGQALQWVTATLRQHPDTIIVGGELAVLNGSRIVNGKLQASRFPRNPLVIFQIIEYIKSFMVSRTGLGKIKSLLVMSGAFSVFRKEPLIQAGSFLSETNRHPTILKYFRTTRQTVCEDLEVVIRMKRFALENKQPADVMFLPHPVCWTEVPETVSQLSRQRERWHRGLSEALYFHRQIIFDPLYRSLGLLAMPYYLFFEWFSPLAKVTAILFVISMFFVDMLHGMWLLMLILSITFGAALLMSVVTVVVESWSIRRSQVNREALRYRGLRDWLALLFFSILSDFTYAYMRVVWQIKGIVKSIRGEKSWNKFGRKGVIVIKEQK